MSRTSSRPTVIDQYGEVLQRVLREIFSDERDAIERTAQLAARSIASGGVLHVFGTGHSHLIALEAYGRAGGLAAVNAILDFGLTPFNRGRDGTLERLHGYADIVVETEDLRQGEVAIVVSNSGINAVPIEFALACKARGLTTVALTNLNHSRASDSRHVSGSKLYEVADIVIDTHGVAGDAAVDLDGTRSIGPTSTVAAAAVVNAITARIAQLLVEQGEPSPVLVSQNLPGMEDHNRALMDHYRGRSRLA